MKDVSKNLRKTSYKIHGDGPVTGELVADNDERDQHLLSSRFGSQVCKKPVHCLLPLWVTCDPFCINSSRLEIYVFVSINSKFYNFSLGGLSALNAKITDRRMKMLELMCEANFRFEVSMI